MEAQTQNDPSCKCQRNKVPGKIDMLKTVSTFELGERVLSLIYVHILSIREVAKSLLIANLDCLGNQSIHRSLIIMLVIGDNIEYVRSCSAVQYLYKAYEFILIVGSNKFRSVKDL